MIAVLILVWVTGCSSDRVAYQFRDAATKQPLVGRSVSLHSGPRIYSFLDPRHYDLDARREAAVTARTDGEGVAVFDWPHGAPYVWVDDEWVLFCPAEWAVMRPRTEVEGDAVDPVRHRPEVRMTSVPSQE